MAGKMAAGILDDIADESPWFELEFKLYDAVLAQYQASIERYGKKTKYDHLGAEAALLENARLLWMQKYPGQLWTPPGEEDELLEEYGDG